MVHAARAPKQLTSGDVIAGKFVVEKTIGMGGMGQVVCARHHELGTRVAIKVVHVDQVSESDSVARFKREARAMAKLTSEHAVRVYDVGETESGLPFMIMEYLEGRDLGSLLIEKGPLPIDDVLSYMIQATDALIEAHEAGIVHRDLKPQNLFVSKRASGAAHLRVLDFGLAKPMKMVSQESRKLTRPGDIIGTSHYMAPEQIRGLELDPRTDVWGAGACMYRLLTRKFPFPGESAPFVCACILSERPVPLRSVRPDAPPALEAIVHRCLEKQPEDRYQSMRELAAALRGVRETKPSGKIETTLPIVGKGAGAPDDVTIIDARIPGNQTLVAPITSPIPPSQRAGHTSRPSEEVVRTLAVPNAHVGPPPPTQLSPQASHHPSARYEATRISAGQIPAAATQTSQGPYPPQHHHSSGRVSLSPVQQEVSSIVAHDRPFAATLQSRNNIQSKKLVAGIVLGIVWAAILLGGVLIVALRHSPKRTTTPTTMDPASEPPPAAASLPPSPSSPPSPETSASVGVSASLDPPQASESPSSATHPPPPTTTRRNAISARPTANATSAPLPTPPTAASPPAPAPRRPTPATSSHYDHL